MKQTLPQFPLLQFTFYSLQFCGTSVRTWRGQQLMTAVNQWYIPFIQAGSPVPLSLVIDLATLLLNPREVPQQFQTKTAVSPELNELSKQYRDILDHLKKDPDFQYIVGLVQSTSDPAQQSQLIRSFLEIMFAPISGIRNVYSFTNRDLEIEKARITSRGAEIVIRMPNGTVKSGQVFFGGLHKVAETSTGYVIRDVLIQWIEAIAERPLSELFTPPLKIVLGLTATTRSGKGRVDYHLLNWLLNRTSIEGVEQEDPEPKMVDEELPTNPFQTEGQTGGFMDVQLRKFSGRLGEVLPSELGFWKYKPLMLQKLLNEGMLTYVRESFEFIDRELRLLFCFIIDNHPSMLQTRLDTHEDLPKGITAYIRARALAALMCQDLCRFLPRKNVYTETGLYLWSTPGGPHDPFQQPCPAEFDLLGIEATQAEDLFFFLRALMSSAPELFYSRVGEAESQTRSHLESNPDEFILNRHRQKRFHARHLIILSSRETSEELLTSLQLDLHAQSSGPDSIFVVNCDVDETTCGLECPDQFGHSEIRSRVSEEFLRQAFIHMVTSKAAGKPVTSELFMNLESMI